MSTKYTPGPWTIKYSGDNGLPLIEPDHARADDPIIAKCYGRRGDADARLIAAAPELLEALIDCEKFFVSMAMTYKAMGFDPMPNVTQMIERVRRAMPGGLDFSRAALAKAEGTP